MDQTIIDRLRALAQQLETDGEGWYTAETLKESGIDSVPAELISLLTPEVILGLLAGNVVPKEKELGFTVTIEAFQDPSDELLLEAYEVSLHSKFNALGEFTAHIAEQCEKKTIVLGPADFNCEEMPDWERLYDGSTDSLQPYGFDGDVTVMVDKIVVHQTHIDDNISYEVLFDRARGLARAVGPTATKK